MKRRAFIRAMTGASAGAIIGGATWGAQERLRLTTTRVTIPVVGLPPSFVGFRIGLLTDLHRSGLVPPELIADAVTRTMAERPDLIVLGGDYITQFDTRFAEPVADLLSPLSAPAGVVAVLSNHDDEHVVPAALTRRGIRVLREDRLRLTMAGDSVDVIGIGYWTQRAAKIAPLIAPEALPVLIAHTPRRLSEAVALRIPLVLSGHTHGGQIAIPPLGPLNRWRFPIVEGLLQQADTALFVSRGIGTIYLPVRINCPPEVAIVTLIQPTTT